VASHLITIRPDFLHRENTTGRTPLEVASDSYLQERVKNGPSIAAAYSYYQALNDNSGTANLASKPPKDFLQKEEIDELSSKKRTYEICLEAAERNPAKRRLVTLFEANEVAKRLVGSKKKSRVTDVANRLYSGGREVQDEDEEKRDEVSLWIGF
jgi:hypothetical protein